MMKFQTKTLLAIACISLLSLSAFAQQKISGVIRDSQGEPVIGAGVVQNGTNNGAVTDVDGRFSLSVPVGATVTVSCIGFKDETFTVDSRTSYILELKDDSQLLQGVEVVAYGVQQKVSVTGALSSVKSEDIVRTPVTSVTNVLSGMLSGVSTIQYSGEPGNELTEIYVRGKGTWVNSAPLVLVDGVERSLYDSNGNEKSTALFDINPEDIENITVLKDASATAVFGVRGANGVILVTTKRGSEGRAKINVNLSFSALAATKMLEQADSYEYATFYNKVCDNDGREHVFSDALIQKFKDQSDPLRFPSIKWTDYMIRRFNSQQNHNVSVSGGSDRVKYYVSAGFMHQGGLYKNFNDDYDNAYPYNRLNYRGNLDVNVTNTTKVSFDISGIVSQRWSVIDGGGSTTVLRNLLWTTPFYSPGIIDGKPVTTTTEYPDIPLPFLGDGGNALQTYLVGYDSPKTNTLQMDLTLNQDLGFITKGLSFKAKGSYNSQFTVTYTGRKDKASYHPVLVDGVVELQRVEDTKNGVFTQGESSGYGKARSWYFESSLNYNRTFGDHSVTALALYNQSKNYYPGGAYDDIPRGYIGLVGRVTYDYKKRYLAEFNVGYNGSENFHPDRRFGLFPAGSIGWVVSDEPFFSPLKGVVSFMKLRASVGLVGNDKVGGERFMYLSDPWNPNINTVVARGINIGQEQGFGYNFGKDNTYISYGAHEISKNNPLVTWEKALKQNYGLDINLFNEKLSLTTDRYYEYRYDILLQDQTAPDLIGFNVPYANLGSVRSDGWEVSARWRDRIGSDFNYYATVNYSYNHNYIVDKKEAPWANEYQYERGKRIGARLEYKFFRFYDSDTPALYEKEYGKPFPEQLIPDLQYGDATYVDLDGNGKIDPNDMTREYGYTEDPQHILGVNAGFVWKKFEFNMQWAGAFGVTRMLGNFFRIPFQGQKSYDQGGLLKYHVYNTWDPENPSQDAKYPRASWKNGPSNNWQESTLYEQDASYLRLKTLQLAYNMDFPFLRAIGVDRLQVALSGYNLLTFTHYIWGDPEGRTVDALPTYPLQKTYTLGLRFNF